MAADKPCLREVLHPRTVLPNGIEVAILAPPRLLKRELKAVLPGVDLSAILVVPSAQKSKLDLVNVGADVAAEKDALLLKFTAWAEGVRSCLAASGHWADYVDPCSGLPMYTKNFNVIYPEVDTFQLLLRYRSESAGPCKILMHPEWGSHVYPATLFSTAPADVLLAALESAAGK